MRTYKQTITSKIIFVPRPLYRKVCEDWSRMLHEKGEDIKVLCEPPFLYFLLRDDEEKIESVWLRKMLENLIDKEERGIWVF